MAGIPVKVAAFMTIKAILLHLVAIFLVAAIGMVCWLIYLVWFAYEPPLRVNYSHPIIVSNITRVRSDLVDMPTVRPGQVFNTFRDYCITTVFYPLWTERLLIPKDGDMTKLIVFPLVNTRIVRDKGTCEARTFDVVLPINARPGEYWFRAQWTYKLNGNPIASYPWQWPDVSLTVVAPDPVVLPKGARGPAGAKGEKGDAGGFSLFGKK